MKYNLVRVLLGVQLLVMAGLQGHQLTATPTSESALLASQWGLILIVEFELFLGICLLASVWAKAAWVAALGFSGMFGCVSLWIAVSGGASCGGFGLLPFSPWYAAALGLAIACSLVRWRPRESSFAFGQALAVLAVWFLIGLPGAYVMAACARATISDAGEIAGDSTVVVLEPEQWVGEQFSLLEYIDVGDQLAKGKWLVVLYHHDCPECRSVLPKYEQLSRDLASRGEPLRVALIEMPPYAPDWLQLVSPDMRCLIGHLSDEKEWFMTTPQEVVVHGAEVTNIGHQELLAR